MALPLLLAPIAGFVGAIAGKLLDGIIKIVSKKFLINAALIVAFLASYGVLLASVNGLLSAVDIATLPPFLITGFSALPTNTDNVFSILIAIKLAVLIFRMQTNIIWLKKV